MIARLASAFLLAVVAAVAMAQDEKPRRILNLEDVKVVEVLAGDTIAVRGWEGGPRGFEGPLRKIRLAGIDAPEPSQPFGPAAKKELASIVAGHFTSLRVTGRDRSGCEIAWVFAGPEQELVNLEMVRRGLAWKKSKGGTYSSEDFEKTEREAREARRGLWRDLDSPTPPVAPWKWGGRR